MAITDVFKRALMGEMRLSRGRVAAIEPDGRIWVRIGAERGQDVACDVLRLGAERVAQLTAPAARLPGEPITRKKARTSAAPISLLQPSSGGKVSTRNVEPRAGGSRVWGSCSVSYTIFAGVLSVTHRRAQA